MLTVPEPVFRHADDDGALSIGTVGEHVSPVIVKNNFHNVPPTGVVAAWDIGFPGTADPEQFFIR